MHLSKLFARQIIDLEEVIGTLLMCSRLDFVAFGHHVKMFQHHTKRWEAAESISNKSTAAQGGSSKVL